METNKYPSYSGTKQSGFVVDKNKRKNENNARKKIGQIHTTSEPPVFYKPKHLLDFFSEYAENSTIHGVRYFGDGQRHWTERMYWLVAFILSVIVCYVLVSNVLEKWNQKPIIISFAERASHISEIPFPAILVCPIIKGRSSRFDYVDAYTRLIKNRAKKMTSDDKAHFEALSHICAWIPGSFIYPKLENYTELPVIPNIKKLAPKLNETTKRCIWGHRRFNCDYMFDNIITEEGNCFTFNTNRSGEIFSEEVTEELKTNWTLDTRVFKFPFRSYIVGKGNGLNINFLFKHSVEGSTCGEWSQFKDEAVPAFKIALHYPLEIPQISKDFFYVYPFEDVQISMKPRMVSTEGLANYDPNVRQCYFDSERKLRFYRSYTQTICEMECLSNHTLVHCGCVKFSMPRDNRTKVCGITKINCHKFLDWEMDLKDQHEKWINLTQKKCNCLPSCTSITYDTEISQTVNLPRENNQSDQSGIAQASLTVFFKELEFIPIQRTELYGRYDFIAYCGGILGLCIGFSLLSVIEVLYYCTFRLCCRFRQRSYSQVATVHTKIPNKIIMEEGHFKTLNH